MIESPDARQTLDVTNLHVVMGDGWFGNHRQKDDSNSVGGKSTFLHLHAQFNVKFSFKAIKHNYCLFSKCDT